MQGTLQLELPGLDRKRNSWECKSVRLLGEEVRLGSSITWRVKQGQRGVSIGTAVATVLFFTNEVFFAGENVPLFVSIVLCVAGIFVCVGAIYFRNFSFAVARRTIREFNVVVLIVLLITNVIMDCLKPTNVFAPINGAFVLVFISCFVFIDALIVKSRIFVVVFGIVIEILIINVVYQNTFGKANIGVILHKYGDNLVLYKGSLKRSCFVQIFLFSCNGIWIMLKDKDMKMLMFSTGNVYRETGTTSEHIVDEQHSSRLQHESLQRLNEIQREEKKKKLQKRINKLTQQMNEL